MEKWQIDWIRKNYVELLCTTICTERLLSTLQTKHVLNRNEVEELEDEVRTVVKVQKFYDILMTRNCYDSLAEELEHTRQTGAAIILRNGKAEHKRQINPEGQGNPPANIRWENGNNVITRLGTSMINYSDDVVLGMGATSIVYRGYFGSEVCPAAIKRVKKEQYDVFQNELEIFRQVGQLNMMENLNVIKLYCDMEFSEGKEGSTKWYYFAMELADCDLAWRIKDISTIPYEDYRTHIKSYLHDAANGLKWIHSRRIIHRDIKPENILIFKAGQGCKEVAKLGDFGISRKLSEIGTGTNSMGKGTTNWMAPEAMRALNDKVPIYSRSSLDIFPFGMTAHFALSRGLHPFEQDGQIFIPINILKQEVLPTGLQNSTEYAANHLFSWMMQKKAEQRPTIENILAHPFFWDEKTCLHFLVDVARNFDKKHPAVQNIRNQLDMLYSNEYKYKNDKNDEKNKKNEFHWLEVIGPPANKLILTRTDGGQKEYDDTKLMKLVELVRDKTMHFRDMPDTLKSADYFGDASGQEANIFSEKKYVKFFMNNFPDLIIFLFGNLLKGNRSELDFIPEKYFKNCNSSFPI